MKLFTDYDDTKGSLFFLVDTLTEEEIADLGKFDLVIPRPPLGHVSRSQNED